jgi:hypothetical protein
MLSAAALFVAVVAGCSSGSPGQIVASEVLAATASGACAEVLLKDHYEFKYIGVSVERTICRPTGDAHPSALFTDKNTGDAVDFGDLAAADRFAFHAWHASMEPEFREQLEAPGADQPAYVWFYVDETDLPNKEWLVAEPKDLAVVAATREARMRVAGAEHREMLLEIPGLDVMTDVGAPSEYGIPVLLVRGNLAALEAAGSLPGTWRIDPVPKKEDLKPADDTYYTTTLENIIDLLGGLDGTGQTVAIFEYVYPNSWANLPGAPSGNCTDRLGASRKCHCSAGTYGDDELEINHATAMMGVVRRSTGILGMANDATTIMANWSGNCTTNGPDAISSALNWATSNGARVISHSECTGTGDTETAHDRFFDYKASVPPYPFIAAAGGNVFGDVVCNKRRNGIVVGGSIETPGSSDRSLVQIDNKSWKNPYASVTEFELPHLTAISERVDTAGFWSGQTFSNAGGTSVAAPQVAGIAASLHEANAALRSWPEVMFAGLMASANEDTDGTVLNLHDSVDDRDGAGLVNAYEALATLHGNSKKNGGNSPSREGHDYGHMYSSSTPTSSWYGEDWFVRVPNNRQGRIAGLLQSRPSCPQNPGSSSCSSNPYPNFGVFLYDGGSLVRYSVSSKNNYQYIAITNSSGVQKDYKIRIYMYNWNGLSSTTFGVAWNSY